MRRTVNILLLVLLTFFGINLWAQSAKKKTAKAEKTESKEEKADTSKKPKRVTIPVYLGNSDVRGGQIPKREFDSLLKEGLVARDSLGNSYIINKFYFHYVERQLYEDSSAHLMYMFDDNVEVCEGSKVSQGIAASIYDRTKEGDTVLIDHIEVMKPDSSMLEGRFLKFAIAK